MKNTKYRTVRTFLKSKIVMVNNCTHINKTVTTPLLKSLKTNKKTMAFTSRNPGRVNYHYICTIIQFDILFKKFYNCFMFVKHRLEVCATF